MAERPYFDSIARLGKALSNPERLRLIELLAQGERSVEDLSGAAELPLKTVSHHLQRLRRAELVACRSQGRRRLYRLADDEVVRLWIQLRGFAEGHSSELQLHLRERERARRSSSPVALSELAPRLHSEEVVLVDVRPAAEYQAGHLAHALPIPLRDLPARAEELGRASQVVVYCRGRHCSLADEAVRLLRAEGVAAQRLDLGVMELRAQGHPLQASTASAAE